MILKNKKGFTLVELLLVMAIIGILAGVIFAAMAPARKRARLANFKQVVKSVNTAVTLCVDGGGNIANTDTVTCHGGSESIPSFKNCDTGATVAAPAFANVTNGGQDNYSFQITCGTCVIQCDMTKCEPTAASAANCN